MKRPDRALLRRTLGAVRRDVALCIASGLAWQAVAVAVPWVLEKAVDQGIVGRDRSSLLVWAAVLLGLGLVRWAGDAARHWSVERAGAHAVDHLRRRLVEKVMMLDDDTMARFGHGDLTARAVGDTRKIWFWMSGIATLATSGFTLVAVLVLLVTLDPELALVGVATVPLAALFAARQVGRYGEASLSAAESSGRFTGTVESAVSGIRAVKGLGSERTVLEFVREASEALRDRMMGLARVEAWWLPIAAGIPAAGIGAGLWIGGGRALEGGLSVGSLVAFAGWMGLLVDATITLSERLTDRGAALAAAARLSELLDLDQPSGAMEAASTAVGWDICVDGVAARRGDRMVLAGLNLDVGQGEWLALVGETGAGKSTLLRLLAGLDRPVTGRVRLGGAELSRIDSAQRAEAVAFVPQGSTLVSGSVAEVLRLAAPDATDEELWRALRAAGAEEVAEGAGGLDGRIGDRGLSLSGGQRQRMALAIAVLRRPRVLLLDDTTSALDPETEVRVLRSVRTYLPEATVVVATHRAVTARGCDRSVVIADGGLVESSVGPVEELLAGSEEGR